MRSMQSSSDVQSVDAEANAAAAGYESVSTANISSERIGMRVATER